MNTLKKLGILVLLVITFKANAQTDKTTTNRIVEEKNYIFVATAAIPLNGADVNNILSRMPGATTGGTISLSGSGYEVRVTPDSVVAYLPYYGRAYTAPMSNDDNGYKFKTKDFTYKSTKSKKGAWDIAISTKDVKDNVKLSLNVSTSGYASLMIMSNNKQSITYNGYLAEPTKKVP